MNKMNLYYIKCRKAAINSSSIELTFCIDIINRLCSYCSDCGLEKITAIDREELNAKLSKQNLGNFFEEQVIKD